MLDLDLPGIPNKKVLSTPVKTHTINEPKEKNVSFRSIKSCRYFCRKRTNTIVLKKTGPIRIC